MEPRVSYALVGLFVLIAGAAFLVATLWLVGVGPTADYRTYAMYPPESVAGIGAESAVKFQGVDVGKVRELSIDPQDPQRVRILLDIRRDLEIRTDTTARLASQGLTGLVYFIELQPGTHDSPPLKPAPGAEFPVIPAEVSELTRLQRTGTELLADARDAAGELRATLAGLRSLLGEDRQGAIGTVIDESGRAAAGLAKAAVTLNLQLERLSPILDDLSRTTGRLPHLAERAQNAFEATGQAALAVNRAAQRLDEVAAKAAPGITALTEDGMPELVSLLRDLRNLTARLDGLASDLEQDPNLLIYGRPRRPGPGER